jgi:hypothetical protein
MPIVEYPFEAAKLEERGYRVFPDELENDPNVCFHGTADENRQPIIEEGFKPRTDLPGAPPEALKSVSFAKGSSLPLQHACEARAGGTKNGCILVVRFATFDNVACNVADVWVYRRDRMPEVIGYCIIPADYKHK